MQLQVPGIYEDPRLQGFAVGGTVFFGLGLVLLCYWLVRRGLRRRLRRSRAAFTLKFGTAGKPAPFPVTGKSGG
jgi:hypothetical protein